MNNGRLLLMLLLRLVRALWEIVCALCISVPFAVLGYFVCWIVGGFNTGRMLYDVIHNGGKHE